MCERKYIPSSSVCVFGLVVCIVATSTISSKSKWNLQDSLVSRKIEQWHKCEMVGIGDSKLLCLGVPICIAALRRWNDWWIDETRRVAETENVWKNWTHLYLYYWVILLYALQMVISYFALVSGKSKNPIKFHFDCNWLPECFIEFGIIWRSGS